LALSRWSFRYRYAVHGRRTGGARDDRGQPRRVHRGYVDKIPGFRVLGEARTAKQALQQVRAHRPDLVLLDIYLPDGSGLDVLRALRSCADVAPDVIVITAARDVETVRAAMHGGVAGYLVKPFTFATFTERMTRYDEGRRNLARAGELEQSDVDRAFELVRHAGPAPLPKGLSATTCARVVEVLRGAAGDLSAVQAAEQVGISRVSARRYLEYLCTSGRAELHPRYGAAGRPEHRYAWTARARG